MLRFRWPAHEVGVPTTLTVSAHEPYPSFFSVPNRCQFYCEGAILQSKTASATANRRAISGTAGSRKVWPVLCLDDGQSGNRKVAFPGRRLNFRVAGDPSRTLPFP